MTMTFLSGLDEFVARKPYVPVSHKNVCDAQKIPRKGNAGGNAKNWLDLTNSNTVPDPRYYGAMVVAPAVNPYTGPQAAADPFDARMMRKMSVPFVV